MKRFIALFLSIVLLVGAVLPIFVFADNGDTTVYITKTGECYHSYGCQYLKKSCIAISLSDAVNQGYRPCSKCNPPTLTVASADSSGSSVDNTYNASSETPNTDANKSVEERVAALGGDTSIEALRENYTKQLQKDGQMISANLAEIDGLKADLETVKTSETCAWILFALSAAFCAILCFKTCRLSKEVKTTVDSDKGKER
ncbi:MAG: hypothetical protein VB058_05930 [Oscillospiraceae bacterium]|nr:hypothetical protein [Oscillospiraceae bacterium]